MRQLQHQDQEVRRAGFVIALETPFVSHFDMLEPNLDRRHREGGVAAFPPICRGGFVVTCQIASSALRRRMRDVPVRSRSDDCASLSPRRRSRGRSTRRARRNSPTTICSATPTKRSTPSPRSGHPRAAADHPGAAGRPSARRSCRPRRSIHQGRDGKLDRRRNRRGGRTCRPPTSPPCASTTACAAPSKPRSAA